MKKSVIYLAASFIITLGGGASNASAVPTENQFKVVCDGSNKLPPIYLSYTATGDYERLDVTRGERGQLTGKYVQVEQAHIASICVDGQAISAMPKPSGSQTKRGTDRQKTVPTNPSVPNSFTIAAYYSYVFGNFWVPATLPTGHHTHLSQYDITANYFDAATISHFANSLLTATDNFETYHSGKGHIFGPNIAGSGSSGGLTCYPQSVVSETWQAFVPAIVWNSSTATNTCSPSFFNSGQTYRVLAGANDSQQSTFWLYDVGAPSPYFVAPTVTSTNAAFIAGQAGIAFLVASTSPLPVDQYWTRGFQNVSVWTQP